jgi:hypothetical protein
MRIKKYFMAALPLASLGLIHIAAADQKQTIDAVMLADSTFPTNSMAWDCAFISGQRAHVEAHAISIDACGNEYPYTSSAAGPLMAESWTTSGTQGSQFDNSIAGGLVTVRCNSKGLTHHRSYLYDHLLNTQNGQDTYYQLVPGPPTSCWNSVTNTNPPQCVSETPPISLIVSTTNSGTSCTSHVFNAYSLGTTP